MRRGHNDIIKFQQGKENKEEKKTTKEYEERRVKREAENENRKVLLNIEHSESR